MIRCNINLTTYSYNRHARKKKRSSEIHIGLMKGLFNTSHQVAIRKQYKKMMLLNLIYLS